MEATELDLFGQPVLPIKDRRGRPAYAKSTENQRLVALLIARGWTQQRVADYLGCDHKTLRKHFSRELQRGADIIEAEALQVCYAKMRQGNSAAIGRMFDLIDQGKAAPPQPKEDKPEPLGKKERLTMEAGEPTGDWGNLLQ